MAKSPWGTHQQQAEGDSKRCRSADGRRRTPTVRHAYVGHEGWKKAMRLEARRARALAAAQAEVEGQQRRPPKGEVKEQHDVAFSPWTMLARGKVHKGYCSYQGLRDWDEILDAETDDKRAQRTKAFLESCADIGRPVALGPRAAPTAWTGAWEAEYEIGLDAANILDLSRSASRPKVKLLLTTISKSEDPPALI